MGGVASASYVGYLVPENEFILKGPVGLQGISSKFVDPYYYTAWQTDYPPIRSAD